jgi:transposase
MNARDGRKLGRKTQAELRKRAVALVQNGESPELIAASFGFHRSWIYRALAAFAKNGEAGLDVHPAIGRESILDEKKRLALKIIILGKTPDQLKLEFALWTTDQVAAYILKRWNILLSISTITRLLHEMGLSFQKPIVKAFQQNPEAVQKWLDIEYPRIKRMAKKEKAEIYFEDEAGLRSDHHSGRTWGEKGKTPVVKATGARFGFNVISAVNNHGKFCFMILDVRFGSNEFIDFMERLIKWKRNKERIALFYLPPYSPELNPTELTWNTMKNEMGKKTITGPDNMKEQATMILDNFERDDNLIISFYKEKHVRYAA